MKNWETSKLDVWPWSRTIIYCRVSLTSGLFCFKDWALNKFKRQFPSPGTDTSADVGLTKLKEGSCKCIGLKRTNIARFKTSPKGVFQCQWSTNEDTVGYRVREGRGRGRESQETFKLEWKGSLDSARQGLSPTRFSISFSQPISEGKQPQKAYHETDSVFTSESWT